jgi:hypothetical protein
MRGMSLDGSVQSSLLGVKKGACEKGLFLSEAVRKARRNRRGERVILDPVKAED